MRIPHEIEINVDSFNDKTRDGKNENELISHFDSLIEQEKASELRLLNLTGFEQFCLYGGIAIAVIGLIMMITGSVFLGLIALIAGGGMVINHFSKKKKVEAMRQAVVEKYENKRASGAKIIRATVAEIVDFRAEFADKDAESQKVIDFLEQISPEQYVRKLADSNRRIKIAE